MNRVNFDLDVLRSFVSGLDLGSYAKAADRLGRSTSAVSAQLKKLEEQAGTAIFRKSGRGLALTEAGETMLGYARRLLDLNDEAATALRGLDLEGWVRLGMQEDFAEALLPEVLGRFARAHPRLKIEARVGRNAELLERVTTGKLDLALAWSIGGTTPHANRVAEVPLCWIGPAGAPPPAPQAGEALALAALAAPCLFRAAATQALDQAGISWRIAFESQSLAGLWAAAAAGLGLSLRTPLGLTPRVRVLGPESRLPPLGSLDLVLHRAEAEPDPTTSRLAEILLEALQPLADSKRTPVTMSRLRFPSIGLADATQVSGRISGFLRVDNNWRGRI